MPKSKLAVIGHTNGIKVEIPNFMSPRYPEDSFRHYLMGKKKGKTLKPSKIHTNLELTYTYGGFAFDVTIRVVLGLKDSKVVITSQGDRDGKLLVHRETDPESPDYNPEGYTAYIYKKDKDGKYTYSKTTEAKVICDKKRLLNPL